MPRSLLPFLGLLAACAPDLAIEAPGPQVDGPLGQILIPNWDDDDLDGVADFGTNAADDDLIALTIPASASRGLKGGETLVLSLSGEDEHFRVWHDGRVVLGGPAGDAWTLPARGEHALWLEAGMPMAEATLTLARVARSGKVRDEVALPLTTAPLILNHHLQPAEAIWVMAVREGEWNNDAMVASLGEIFGEALNVLPARPYRSDVWVQDEPEFGTFTAPGARDDLVLDSVRNRGLDAFPKDLMASGIGAATLGDRRRGRSTDSFGNLEVTPPIEVDGVAYPFGRIYYGATDQDGPDPILQAFLDAQRVQTPFRLDTSWLCVGHVDEFTSFVPDPTAPRGFRLLVSDPAAAWEVLDALEPSTPLPRYADGHGYATVGALVDDAGLRTYNDGLWRDRITPALDVFRDAIGLRDEEIVPIPGLFERISGCGAAALIPGAVNLLLADVDGTPHAVLADPFLRPGDTGQDDDPLVADLRDRLPASLDVHFVDDWEVYHLGLGEVHCGTNTRRTPEASWWVDALHLVEAR